MLYRQAGELAPQIGELAVDVRLVFLNVDVDAERLRGAGHGCLGLGERRLQLGARGHELLVLLLQLEHLGVEQLGVVLEVLPGHRLGLGKRRLGRLELLGQARVLGVKLRTLGGERLIAANDALGRGGEVGARLREPLVERHDLSLEAHHVVATVRE